MFSYIVFGAICLVFVFLAPMGTKLMGEGILAYVGGEPIRMGEWSIFKESIKRQYQSRLDQADEEAYSEIQKQIEDMATRQIIEMYLIFQGSKKEGFFLSDQELREEIRSFPLFQQKGRFSYSLYQAYLKSQRLRPERFENRIRKAKIAENWLKTFRKAIPSNELELAKRAERNFYKVNFRHALLSAESLKEQDLEGFVRQRNLPQINKFLKDEGVQWEETGLISLFSNFNPITQNKELMSALLSHLPLTGVVPQLIRSADKIYILNVLSFKKVEKLSRAEKQLENILNSNFDKSERAFAEWLNFQRERIPVQLSDNI